MKFRRYPLTQEEIQQIKEGLKQKWDIINRKFQMYAHITKIDTVGSKRRFLSSKKKNLKLFFNKIK